MIHSIVFWRIAVNRSLNFKMSLIASLHKIVLLKNYQPYLSARFEVFLLVSLFIIVFLGKTGWIAAIKSCLYLRTMEKLLASWMSFIIMFLQNILTCSFTFENCYPAKSGILQSPSCVCLSVCLFVC